MTTTLTLVTAPGDAPGEVRWALGQDRVLTVSTARYLRACLRRLERTGGDEHGRVGVNGVRLDESQVATLLKAADQTRVGAR